LTRGEDVRYSKANSISALRATGAVPEITERLERVRASLIGHTDDQSRIVLSACRDLLGPPEDLAGPRFCLRHHVVQEMSRLADSDLPRYLHYRYRYEMYPETQRVDRYPPCLQIEPTSICNYRCVFCFQTDPELTQPENGHMGSMDLGLFMKIVDEAEGQCEAVTLASRGEPLLCRQIEPMLSYLAGKFLALKLNTNAWFLDERKAHAILESGVDTLVISADAADETLYRRLRVNGRLERVVENVERFQRIRGRSYPASRMITRVSGVRYTDEQSIAEMERRWSGLVDQVAFVDYNPWENIYRRRTSGITTPCSDLFRRTFAWFDGRVNPCDVDYLSHLCAGNASQTTIGGIWTGEAYSRLREMHLEGSRCSVGPCDRCAVV